MSRLIRLAGLCGIGAATGFAVIAIHSLLEPGPQDWRNAAMLAPWVLTMALLAGVQAAQSARATRSCRRAFWTTEAAMLVNGVLMLLVALGVDDLRSLVGPAVLVWIVGMLWFGVCTARNGTFPRIVGVAIAAAEPLVAVIGLALSPIAPLSDYGSYTGALGHTLAMGLVAVHVLRTPEREPQPRPERHRVPGGEPMTAQRMPWSPALVLLAGVEVPARVRQSPAGPGQFLSGWGTGRPGCSPPRSSR